MRMLLFFRIEMVGLAMLLFASLFQVGFSQLPTETPTPTKRNSPYSPNPKKKDAPIEPKVEIEKSENVEPVSVEKPIEIAENTTSSKILKVVSDASKIKPLTESYRVGIKDVLLVSLKSSKLQNTSYVTVLADGTIDYPLAGGNVNVENTTLEEIQDFLREKIIFNDKEKAEENVEVIVKIREAASHNVKVIGLVEKSGDKMIQRDAVPLFIIKAEAILLPQATQVIIRRVTGETEKFELKDISTDDTLIYPNDIIEFVGKTENTITVPKFYFVTGGVNSPGQRDFHDGLTLTQAIYAAGGLKRERSIRVVIRRKNEQGLLTSIEFDIKTIKDGKTIDPAIQIGDLIEVYN
jgi:protein involved in polysaccharide export with SLBB domain